MKPHNSSAEIFLPDGKPVAAALKRIAHNQRPEKVIGCEIWRNLDWLPDVGKVLMDASGRDNLAAALHGVFDSQIAAGKRCDLTILGRRAANATFFESHATDRTNQLIFGMVLTPLVTDETKGIVEFVRGFIEYFRDDVKAKLGQLLGYY